MATLKRSQVVRLNRSVSAEDANGNPITVPSNTRALVMHMNPETKQYRVTIRDQNRPEISGLRINVGESRLNITHRGRPKGTGKHQIAAAAAAETEGRSPAMKRRRRRR